MNPLFPLLSLILAGKLECSIFNFDFIEKEIESSISGGMPKITTSKVAAREIGFGPAIGIAADTTDTAFGVSPTAIATPVEVLDRNSHFEPSCDVNFLKTTISDKSIPFSPREAADDSSPVTKASELIPRASPKNDDILRARDSFDHRSSSVRSSLSNNLHRILVSPLPSSSPIPLPSNISGNLNNKRVPKRAREETSAVFDGETQDYIDAEVIYLNKRSNDLAAVTTDTAFGVSPTAISTPVEDLDRNSHFEPSCDENFLKTTIRDTFPPRYSSPVTKASELTPRASPKNGIILRACDDDSFDQRSSSGRASPSNDLPRGMVSPLPSISPIQLPSNISGSLNNERVPKRAREETDAVFDRETQDYIDAEVIYLHKNPGKCAVLRKAIELIAQNNYKEFIAYEPNFVEEFKCKYRQFKKKPGKAYYMIQYIIRFGATNFLQSPLYCKSQKEVDEISKFEAAFDHLIRTKPFEVAMQFIRTMWFMNNESVTKSISAAMEARYPNLHFLDFVVFEIDYSQIFSIKVCDFHKIIATRNEEEKLNHFTNFLMKLSKDLFIGGHGRAHYSYNRYLKAFFKYSEYFMSLKIDIREMFAKFAIINEDLDSLSKIIDMDPEIIFHNQFDSLFAFAARSRCAKTFQFFMDIVPEHATTAVGCNYSPIAFSVFTDSLNNIKAFDDCGFDFSQDIRHSGNITAPIKLAFKSKSADVLNFFIDKFGKEFIMAQLLQVYGSVNEIIQQASSGFTRNDKFHLILKNRLGLCTSSNE
jgi:hypothetical protein